MWPHAFQPLFGNTGPTGIEQSAPVVIAADVTASAVTRLPGNPQGDPVNPVICVENTTNGWAFCNFGDANVPVATINNGIGVPPGSIRFVQVRGTTNSVSVILEAIATGGPVRFLRGNGAG